MASPQLENGYLSIANEIVDALIKEGLSGQEIRLALLIIRKTYGFHKKKDAISLTQMARASGLSVNRCSQVINSLEDKRIALSENLQGISKTYRFNKNYEQWRGISKKRYPKSTLSENCILPYRKTDSTKDTITKEININILTKTSGTTKPLTTPLIKDTFKAVCSSGVNIYQFINKLKKDILWRNPAEFNEFVEKIVLVVCQRYLEHKDNIDTRGRWPWLATAIKNESAAFFAGKNISENTLLKNSPARLGDLLNFSK